MKRAVDFTCALLGLIVLSPLLLVIALAVKLTSRGPVIFKQTRIGRGKRQFEMYKFRTMKVETPSDVPTHLMASPDTHLTSIGRFLRRTSLDELPQMANILKGDMSIVGPRPALWNQYELIEARDQYGANDVRPGLTGWAQINGRDEPTIAEKAALDGYYARHRGPTMDLKCVFGSIGAVARAKGVVEGVNAAADASASEAAGSTGAFDADVVDKVGRTQ